MGGARRAPWGQAFGTLLLGAAVVVAVGTARAYRDGKRCLAEAMRLESQGDLAAAIAGFEDAAKAYFPGSPCPGRALRELEILAKAAEMRGDFDQALAVWEVIRRAILATRHVVQPHGAVLDKAEAAIRRVAERRDPGRSRTPDRLTVRPNDPSALVSLALLGGLVAWAGGALAFFLGLPRDRSGLQPRRALPLAFSAGGLLVWLASAWVAG